MYLRMVSAHTEKGEKMTTIRLLDARRGLNRKCEELFGNAKIAEEIYRFLCDGIEECEDAEPERKKGKWIEYVNSHCECPFCHKEWSFFENMTEWFNFCPNCGAEMEANDDRNG